MKYKAWDFLVCWCKDDHKYLVVWSWIENWYMYYNLRDIEKESDDILLVDFVDEKFKKIDLSFFKRMYLLYFINFRIWKK